jgi:hypothetical protein
MLVKNLPVENMPYIAETTLKVMGVQEKSNVHKPGSVDSKTRKRKGYDDAGKTCTPWP